MWTCANCGERVEDSFDLCWKCSTSRDGTHVEPPSTDEMEEAKPISFGPQPELPPIPDRTQIKKRRGRIALGVEAIFLGVFCSLSLLLPADKGFPIQTWIPPLAAALTIGGINIVLGGLTLALRSRLVVQVTVASLLTSLMLALIVIALGFNVVEIGSKEFCLLIFMACVLVVSTPDAFRKGKQALRELSEK